MTEIKPMNKEEYDKVFARKNEWAKEAIKGIDPSGMTENEYNRAQARAMIKKMNTECKEGAREAYEDQKRRESL